MTNEEYTLRMYELGSAVSLFRIATAHIPDAELAHMLEAVSLADSVGAILDPTAYRGALADGRLERQRALVQAVVDFRSAVKSISPPAGVPK